VTAPRGGRVPLWLPWSVMAAVVVVALAVGSVGTGEPPTNAERVQALTQQIKCPQCAGQSVAESDVSVSREIRRDIAQRVEEGQTDDEIRAYYASDTVYGPDAILSPPTSGVGGLVWALPVLLLVAAAVVLAVVFRRWSVHGRPGATDDDRALVARQRRQVDGDG
jgi:cytochrome c-type biogenesis protein CcmH